MAEHGKYPNVGFFNWESDDLTREFVFIIQAALTLCRTLVPANSGFLLLIWQIGEDLIDTALTFLPQFDAFKLGTSMALPNLSWSSLSNVLREVCKGTGFEGEQHLGPVERGCEAFKTH